MNWEPQPGTEAITSWINQVCCSSWSWPSLPSSRARRRRPATPGDRWRVDGPGPVVCEQPRRAERRLPEELLLCGENIGMVFGAWDYGPVDLDKLSNDLDEAFVRNRNPWGGAGIALTLDPSADMRSAWVTLRDNCIQVG